MTRGRPRTEKGERIRIVIRKLIDSGHIGRKRRTGAQKMIAQHFGVSPRRISVLVGQELDRR